MKVISGIVDEIFLSTLGMVCFYESESSFGIKFDTSMKPVEHICKEVKRK